MAISVPIIFHGNLICGSTTNPADLI